MSHLKGHAVTRWNALSKRYRKANPLCEHCMREGRVAAAFAVDHIIPHKGKEDLLFDVSNLQSLCERCHNSYKQGLERRGYDNAVALDGWPTDPMHPANR
jgi:5-methylcytosine-specific restriction protein A